jgi:hypothetical protein
MQMKPVGNQGLNITRNYSGLSSFKQAQSVRCQPAAGFI